MKKYALLLSALAGCGEASDSTAPFRPDRAASVNTQCAEAPDVIVTTLPQLHAALASAAPDAVIAIDGTIDVPLGQVPEVRTPGIRLTCLTAGSGLRATATGPAAILRVRASDVVVHGLTFDSRNSVQSAVTVMPGPAGPALRVQITRNSFTCSSVCAFVLGAANSVVADNEMESGAGASSGVHVQRSAAPENHPTDGTRVERNTIRATSPSVSTPFGGIRVRDGRALVVSDNTVSGPWANSIAAVALEASLIERNALTGAANHGVVLGLWPALPRAVNGIVIRTNQIRAAGRTSVLVVEGCQNLLLGNLLQGSPNSVAFDARAGANTYVGNANLVADAGAVDCDGDALNDPNVITGPGRARTGPLGFAIHQGVQLSNELR